MEFVGDLMNEPWLKAFMFPGIWAHDTDRQRRSQSRGCVLRSIAKTPDNYVVSGN